MRLGVLLATHHHLRHAGVVAQINEDQVAQVAPAVHPSGQKHLLANVCLAQLAAHVRSTSFTEQVELHNNRG